VGLVGAEVDILQNIWKAFRDEEKEELVVKVVEELWKGHSKSVQVAE
jgi:hypothetical protein